MTHLEKFIALYKDFGIELKPVTNEQGTSIILTVDGKKFKGYSMFYSDVQFDKDGNFIKQEFWE